MAVNLVSTQCLKKPEEGAGSPGLELQVIVSICDSAGILGKRWREEVVDDL